MNKSNLRKEFGNESLKQVYDQILVGHLMFFVVVLAVALIKLYDIFYCCRSLLFLVIWIKNWPLRTVELCSQYPTTFCFCIPASVVCITFMIASSGFDRLSYIFCYLKGILEKKQISYLV